MGWGERRVVVMGGGFSRFSRGLPAVASAAAAAAIDCRRVAVTDSRQQRPHGRFEKGCRNSANFPGPAGTKTRTKTYVWVAEASPRTWRHCFWSCGLFVCVVGRVFNTHGRNWSSKIAATTTEARSFVRSSLQAPPAAAPLPPEYGGPRWIGTTQTRHSSCHSTEEA